MVLHATPQDIYIQYNGCHLCLLKSFILTASTCSFSNYKLSAVANIVVYSSTPYVRMALKKKFTNDTHSV